MPDPHTALISREGLFLLTREEICMLFNVNRGRILRTSDANTGVYPVQCLHHITRIYLEFVSSIKQAFGARHNTNSCNCIFICSHVLCMPTLVPMDFQMKNKHKATECWGT